MAITPWDDIKAQVGYDELPTEGKVDTINKYSQYVQEYYTQVEPRDEKEVGQASDEFVKIASQDALGDLGAVERGSAFLGNIYKGASGTFTSAFKAAALAQQAIGESLGNYDDNTPVTERDIYKIAQNIDESVKQTTGIEDPRLRNDFINTLLPQGLGSALGFFGVAAAAAAAAPEAAVGAVGLGTAAVLGAATNAGSTYEEARQAGANEFTSRASALAGGAIGLTEAIPLGGLAGRLTAGIAKRSILRGVVEGATEEFLQETGSQMANNFVASKFAGYDPNRGIMDGALQSGAVGLVTGGLIGGGVNAITRDNEAFYAEKLSDELKSKADLAASLTPERLTQITEAARNANTTTQQRIDIETGETETTSTPKTVFGDRLAGEVPDIGQNPAINSVPLGRSVSQDGDGNNTETFTFHTPQGLLWEAEFRTGQPVRVRDVTDDSPLLNPITSPADPRTATRSQFTGRIISPTSSIAKEFGLETEQEMDRRLIAEAQREMQLGRVTDQTLLPDNQIIPESVSRDDRGVARQVVLSNEIERLYKIREGVLARQILVGENPNAGTTEYDPNTAREVIRYDSEGNKIENKQETSQRVARLNRMIGMRETELRGLTARPEGYILASERNTPPSASQKLSLVQGFQNLWNSISSPALRNAITFEVGDITPLIESGQVPKGAVAYYKRASDGRKAMIFLSDKLATMPMARREMIHELGHAFWDTLPAGVQAEIRGLWRAETESRTGALFDEFGGLKAEVSPRVMESVQEFFSERLAWTNDQWAKGLSEQNSVMDKAGRAFRNLLDRFLRYTGHGERLNLEFRSFLDQGDRFKGLRTRVEQAVRAGRAGINEEPQTSIRGLTGNENIQPKKERVGTTGQYVGMPEGINSPEKLQELQDKLQSLTFEGEAGRFWYERSSEEILKMVGGNVKDAETLVAFIAAYSPQNRVYPNWGQAVRAYAEYKRGQKITQGKTGRDIERGQRIADGERWSGIKTNNFYHNLMIRIDPSQTVKGATVDMWIMRVFGYKSDAPSATQYAAAENTIKEIARRIGWEPQQVQAAMWVAGKAKWEDIIWPEIKAEAKRKGDLIQVENEAGKKKWEFRSKEIAEEYRNKAMSRVFDSLNVDIKEAAMDFSDMAKRNLATVSMETRFGTTTNERWQDNLSFEQLLQYHQQKEQILTDTSGINIVLREFGVPMDNMYSAVGLWKSQTNPLTQIEVPSYRDTGSKRFAADKNIKANLDDAISALGLLLKQDGMAYHQPYFDAQVKDSNGVEFRLGRKTTAEETAKLNDAFNSGYAIVNVRDGFRVLKFDDSMDNVAFHKDAKARVESIFDDSQSIQMDRFAFDGNLIENDWSKNTNGENYRSRIKESGRSDILGRLEDNLRPQIERLDAYWRGIAESGGRTETESAGRQGAGTKQSPQVGGIQEAGSPEVRASTRGAQPRNEVIQQAANDFFEGRISREELNRISEEQKPARPVTSIPILTDDEARSSLDAGKQGMYGAARTLEEGTPVGLRIDIPSYNRTGNYVVTVHNQAEGKSRVGKVIGYDRIAAVKDARFFNASEKVTLSIAQGYSKTPLATVEGKYIPMANAPAGLLENYQQVGFDPQRHSYFYSKQNGNPVISADEAILIGNTVFVKGAVEGNRGDFLFSTRGEQAPALINDISQRFNLSQELQKEVVERIRLQGITRQVIEDDNDWQRTAIYEAVRDISEDGILISQLPENKKALFLSEKQKNIDNIVNIEQGYGEDAQGDLLDNEAIRYEGVLNRLGIGEERQAQIGEAGKLLNKIEKYFDKREAIQQNAGDYLASTRGEQAKKLLEPVISFGRQQLRTGGALPYDIFRMTEQRGFNVNEKMLRAQNAVSDIEAAVKRSYGKSLDQLPEVEIARINEGLQNPMARAKLPTDVASAVGNARNLIDSLTQDLLRSGAISEDLKPVLEANKGVYLNRSYEKWENPNYKNPFNTLPKQVQNKLVTTVTSYLHNKYANAYAKEQSLARGEVAINPDSQTYKNDYQAGLAKARSGGVTKAEVDGQIEYLASPETDSPFGQIGSGLTKDLSIITARKNIPEEIRMLWGEIKDPRVNFLKSVQKMSGFLEAHNMLKGMRDAGMNKIFFTTPRTGFTTKLVSDGSRTSSPLNMFIDGMSNDVYTSEEISTALRNTFGGRAKAQDFLGKMGELYLKANGFSKFAKTVLSVQTQVRNLLGNGSFLVANGYIFSPDGITALNKLRTLALPSAGTQLGINKSKEFRDYNAKLTRLGILGQSVFANEMESYFKDANVSTAADFLDNHVTKGLKAIGRGATNLYQLGDAIPKIVAFEVELSRLRKAYPTQPLSKLEPMAADKVLNLLPTYSRIPRLGNVLRSQPFVGAFISFPLEVVRTGYNLLGTINDELRSDNPAIRQAGAYRLAGTMMASIGFSAVAAGIASAMGIDDDEDQAIRKLDAPWDKYATKLYLGRDDKGNVNQVNLSYVDPYNYFRDPIIALMKMDGTWDQKLLESVKTAFQPLYGEQILASKILDISRNTKGTTGGRVYNPEADLASRAAAVSAHMFDAFNIGTVVSSVRVYKGLTGQVTQTGRAYDPALETIATLTGQRVVTLDPRQSLGFTARKFSNRLNDATGIFTAAYYDRSNVSNEARMEAYRQMRSSRKEIFNETSGIISAAMKLGVSRGEVMRILKEQGVSMDNSRALLSGNVAVYKPAKREMKGDAIRFGQQVYAEQ
jgi:hypothetical protein